MNMKQNARRFFLTAFIAAAGSLLPAWFGPVFAQSNSPEASHGLPQDWSHKHLLYTNPDTHDEAARKGTLAFEKWKQKNKDPRFAAQAARKARFVQASEHSPISGQQLQWANRHRRDPPPAGPAIHRDWSSPLGGISGVGKANVFPAKFQFDINAPPSCANDFVVFTTTSAGATATPPTYASRTGTFTGRPSTGQTVTIGGTLVLTAGATNSGTTFARSSNTTIQAANLATVINFPGNGSSVGVSASSASAVVTVTATTAGTGGNSITLAEGLRSFSWAGTTLAGGSAGTGQPTIVAFNNLYNTTCAGQVPATYWSYNTGTAAFTETSPVLSLDGTQVAFVQRTGTAASLVLLKWSNAASVGTLDAPTELTSVAAGSYRACATPCMTVIAFSGSPNDTNSSPYYVYWDDILYVGADNGTLHKFTGVFDGTPAEVVGSGWPATVSTGNILSSPIYDSASGLVFVGSTSGTTTGGQLHSVDAASGALVSSARLATNSSAGLRDAPIVDSTAQRVYAFVGSDVSGTSTTCTAAPCMAVYQFPTAITSGSLGTKVQVGRGVTSTTSGFLYAGTFDDAYYTSATPASPSGNLYVCGGRNSGTTQPRPTLFQIPIGSNVMGTPVVGPALVNATANCSPITEVMNGTNDYIYAGVNAGGNDTGCTGACIYMYNLTGLSWGTGAVANAGFAAAGGTSGIIVDNVSTSTGASQIYYSTLTSPGNAIQASQAALQ